MAQLPWEYAAFPGGLEAADGPIALNPRFSIVRDPVWDEARPTLRLRDPLRIVYACAPSVAGYDELSTGEAAKVSDHVRSASSRHLKLISPRDTATYEELVMALDERTDVFHFSGHGESDPAGIIVASKFSNREARKVSAEDLAELLKDAEVQVAVVSACDSARGSRRTWGGLAGVLIEKGVPAVVAMQGDIDDRRAVAFALGFYPSLAETRSVDAAVAAGRREMARLPGFSWGLPALYSRAGLTRGTVREARTSTSSIERSPGASAMAQPSPLSRPVSRARARPEGPQTIKPFAVHSVGSAPWTAVATSGDLMIIEAVGTHIVIRPAAGASRSIDRHGLDAPIDNLVATGDGTAIVAEAGDRVFVIDVGRDGKLQAWPHPFPRPEEGSRILAAGTRRSPTLPLTVLVVSGSPRASSVLLLSPDGRHAREVQLGEKDLRAAAANQDGWLAVGPRDRLVGADPGFEQLARTWLDVDAATAAGDTVLAGLPSSGTVLHALRVRNAQVDVASTVLAVRGRRTIVARSLNSRESPRFVLVEAEGQMMAWECQMLFDTRAAQSLGRDDG